MANDMTGGSILPRSSLGYLISLPSLSLVPRNGCFPCCQHSLFQGTHSGPIHTHHLPWTVFSTFKCSKRQSTCCLPCGQKRGASWRWVDQGCLATMGVEGDSWPGGTCHGGRCHLEIQGRSYMLSPLRIVIASLSPAQRNLC